jgi:hypothetical protein
VTNIVTDFALIILPIPLVVSLQMPKIQKIYLVLIFVIGCAYVQPPLRRLRRPLTILSQDDCYQYSPSHDLDSFLNCRRCDIPTSLAPDLDVSSPVPIRC